MKYRKKPVAIEAWVWDESKDALNFIGCKMMSSSGHRDKPDFCSNLRIDTREGSMAVNLGDYIIKETFDKEHWFYPCKPEIFKMTYDEVAE